MFQGVAKSGAMDRLGIALSGLCVVHCIASAVFVTMLASAGGLLLDPIVHEIGLMLALGLGIVAIGRGVIEHGGGSTAYAIVGVAILALGHDLNRRAVI